MAEDNDGQTACFVGKAPCGHYKYACVWDGSLLPQDFRRMAAMVKRGWTIEAKTVQFVRDGGLFRCTCGAK